ncbi:hypothetical protein GGI43DRAFT_432213 [Trichoderma evansii]
MAPKRAASNVPLATPGPARRSKRLAKIVEEKPIDSLIYLPTTASASHQGTILSKMPMQEYSDSTLEDKEFSDLVSNDDENLYGLDLKLLKDPFSWHDNKTLEEDFDEDMDEDMEEDVAEDDYEDCSMNKVHISDTNEMVKEEKEEQKTFEFFSEILENGLKDMNLPPNLFESSCTDWLETMLNVSEATPETKEEIRNFAQRLQENKFQESIINVLDWCKEKTRKNWHNQCPRMTALWEEYRAKIVDNTEEDTTLMVKPSGALGAIMHVQWNYPTMATAESNKKFGHVLDPSSRSLNFQTKKIGAPPNVSTSDMIPIREKAANPLWEKRYGPETWPKILDLSVNFNYEIISAAPIVVLVGVNVFKIFDEKLRMDSTIKLKMVFLSLRMTIFRKSAFFYVVYRGGEVHQLVFHIYHASHFIKGSTIEEGIYTDLIFNTAARIASVDIISPNYFSTRASARRQRQTKAHQNIIKTRQNNITQVNEVPKQTREEYSAKGLKRAHEVNAATGYLGIKAAQAWNREHGHPNLPKAREALRKGDGPAKALATRENHHKNKKLGKLNALLQSQEVTYLLSMPRDFYKDDALENVLNFFADVHQWPKRWEHLDAYSRTHYGTKLRQWHDIFTEYRESESSFMQMTNLQYSYFLKKIAIWYDKNTPLGLRFDGDKGPKIKADEHPTYNPAISIFWYRTILQDKHQDEFADELCSRQDASSTS